MKWLALLIALPACVINNHPKIERYPLQVPEKKPQKIVTLICDENCSESEKIKLSLIEEKLNKTLSSECFARFILAPGRPYNYMGDETPQTLLEKMRTPQVILVNYFYALNFFLQGFERAGEAVVHINRNAVAIQNLGYCAEASIMAHEVAHAKGFVHKGNEPNEFNQSTAPYTINHAFDPISDDYRNGGCCI
jgi:hypothetical protein